MDGGKFIISLDFELLWGELDLPEKESYKAKVIGGRKAIPNILNLFDKYGIHATWATVGIVGCKGKKQLMDNIPYKIPSYMNKKCSAYEHLSEIGENEQDDPCSFAPSIIETIKSYNGQEIGTHTFSHYYCNEDGADVESFRADIKKAIEMMRDDYGITVKSLVFPRNQAKDEFVRVAIEEGILCWRGSPAGYIISSCRLMDLFNRVLRIADTYLPIFGSLCTDIEDANNDGCCMASRFLRPYNSKLAFLEGMKLRRIKNQMEFAAKKKKVFHLWWHPHNFGDNADIMLDQLEELLKYYEKLNKKYAYESINMKEFVALRSGKL